RVYGRQRSPPPSPGVPAGMGRGERGQRRSTVDAARLLAGMRPSKEQVGQRKISGPSELTRFSPPPFSPDTRLLMTLSTRLCGGRGVGVRGDSDERATMASNPDQKQRARQLRRDMTPAEKASECRVSSEGIPNYEGAANPRGAAPVRSVVGSMSFRCGS